MGTHYSDEKFKFSPTPHRMTHSRLDCSSAWVDGRCLGLSHGVSYLTLSFQSQLELFPTPLQGLSCAGTSKQLSLFLTQIKINTLECIKFLNLKDCFCIPASHQHLKYLNPYLKPIEIMIKIKLAFSGGILSL